MLPNCAPTPESRVSFFRIRPLGTGCAPGARRRLLAGALALAFGSAAVCGTTLAQVATAPQAGMDKLTTRTDGKADKGLLDLGYHNTK